MWVLKQLVLNKIPGEVGLDKTYPIKPGITISKYSIPIKPNITWSPTRKLGDIIMVNDIQRVLSNLFDLNDKSKHHLFKLFFNHPYNSLLNEHFQLPIDNDSVSSSTKVSNSNIQWS